MNSSPLEQIIDIEGPLAYNCRLWGYVPGHSQLLVRVYKDDFLKGETFFLRFEGVYYIECRTSWAGVDFRLGSPEECKAIVRKANLAISGEAMNVFLREHHLFVIDRPDYRIQILAWGLHRLSAVPEEFGESPKV